MEVACGEHGECVEKLVISVENDKCLSFQKIHDTLEAIQESKNDIVKENLNSISNQDQSKVDSTSVCSKTPELAHTVINIPVVSCTTTLLDSNDSIEQKIGFPTNCWLQFWILLKRTFISQMRDMVITLFFLSFCFYNY